MMEARPLRMLGARPDHYESIEAPTISSHSAALRAEYPISRSLMLARAARPVSSFGCAVRIGTVCESGATLVVAIARMLDPYCWILRRWCLARNGCFRVRGRPEGRPRVCGSWGPTRMR